MKVMSDLLHLSCGIPDIHGGSYCELTQYCEIISSCELKGKIRDLQGYLSADVLPSSLHSRNDRILVMRYVFTSAYTAKVHHMSTKVEYGHTCWPLI